MKTKTVPNILWFKDVDHDDLAYVGGKGANLGEMYKIKIPVPNGFVVTAQAYFKFIKKNNLMEQIKKILKSTNIDNPNELLSASQKIRKIIENSSMPDDIAIDIMKAYKKLSKHGGLTNVPVAVRSSATAEDLPDASFAGQQDTFLNVIGEANVVKRVQTCWSSLFTPRAIFYRENKHFNHFKIGIAVPVQKMIQADISGVMFTVNPVNNQKTQIIVESIWGLGEYIVQGKVTPEQYIINKHSWTIESFTKSPQKIQLIKSKDETKETKVPKYKQNRAKINNKTAIKIAKIGQKLHNHYAKAQDIEFALEKGKIYIVQTRPITTLNQKIDKTQITIPEDILGDAASPGIASGKVIILKTPKNISKVKKGDILVSPMTSPDFVPAMKKANGIITDKGGQTSHAAIVSRELGTPCVVGAKIATKKLKNGDIVTLDGSTGKIWFGNLVPSITNIPMDQNAKMSTPSNVNTPKMKTATKIYVNLGEPDLAKDISSQHVDGIGLLRAEFMIANIGIHPKHIIATKKQAIYINKLTKDIGTFCKHFSPRPVIYRATDFKTNEYRHLKWGKSYEPEESNPMLGYRGAGRYITSPDVFEMELAAIKKTRNKLGFKNLWLMIPFVRTVQELTEVKKIIAANGLLRSPSFKLLMMVEIPSNVILLNKFIDVGIDGISIGSNDLTMLTLGLDRDNSEVAKDFNELDPAVIWMLKKAITTAKKREITSSICGQAPSNYPSLVEKLVKWGVTSISVSPDAIQGTRQTVHWAENRKLKK